MARLPYIQPERAAPHVQEALATLPDLNVFRMLAHAESALTPYLGFGSAILLELELDAGLRELAVLQAARTAECEYEWAQHLVIAEHAGVRAEQISALERGDLADDALSDAERAVVELADAVVRGPRPSDATFDRVAAHLSPREIVELLLAVGSYLMLARVLTSLDVEIDAAAADPVA